MVHGGAWRMKSVVGVEATEARGYRGSHWLDVIHVREERARWGFASISYYHRVEVLEIILDVNAPEL